MHLFQGLTLRCPLQNTKINRFQYLIRNLCNYQNMGKLLISSYLLPSL